MNLSRISITLNVLLAIAVAILFYKGFGTDSIGSKSTSAISGKVSDPNALVVTKPSQSQSNSERNILPFTEAKQGQGIYFVNTDTLLSRYGVFKKQKAMLEGKSKRFEQDMATRVRILEGELAQAQQKAQNNQLTQAQAQELEQTFQQKQQALSQYREEQAGKLMEEEKAMSLKLNENIQKYLKTYGTQHRYRYVLGYSLGGGILFANDSLDITAAVVEGLNSQL